MLFFLSEFIQQKQSTEERMLEVNFFSIKPVSRILGGTGGPSGGPNQPKGDPPPRTAVEVKLVNAGGFS